MISLLPLVISYPSLVICYRSRLTSLRSRAISYQTQVTRYRPLVISPQSQVKTYRLQQMRYQSLVKSYRLQNMRYQSRVKSYRLQDMRYQSRVMQTVKGLRAEEDLNSGREEEGYRFGNPPELALGPGPANQVITAGLSTYIADGPPLMLGVDCVEIRRSTLCPGSVPSFLGEIESRSKKRVGIAHSGRLQD